MKEFLKNNKLFQREKMQPLERKDFVKVGAIIGIIVIPILFSLAI